MAQKKNVRNQKQDDWIAWLKFVGCGGLIVSLLLPQLLRYMQVKKKIINSDRYVV